MWIVYQTKSCHMRIQVHAFASAECEPIPIAATIHFVRHLIDLICCRFRAVLAFEIVVAGKGRG